MISLRLAFINPKSRIGSQLLMALMVYELQLTPLLVQGSWKPPAANLSICSPAAVVLMSRRAGMCEMGPDGRSMQPLELLSSCVLSE